MVDSAYQIHWALACSEDSMYVSATPYVRRNSGEYEPVESRATVYKWNKEAFRELVSVPRQPSESK